MHPVHSRGAKRRRGKYSKFLAILDELMTGTLSLSLYRTEREKEKQRKGKEGLFVT
jgi:hypothetical protein